MGDTYRDPVDHVRTTRSHAGESMIDVLRWPGTPAMFAFRDQDGNGLKIMESSSTPATGTARFQRGESSLQREMNFLNAPLSFARFGRAISTALKFPTRRRTFSHSKS